MVIPQTYIRTWPGSIGVNGCNERVSVLKMRKLMGFKDLNTKTASPLQHQGAM